MQKVLTAEQMREVDRLTTERYGIPSILLMENAAHAVARFVIEKLGSELKVTILCGKGNNGGDGAAIARILWSQGADVDLYLFGQIDDTAGDARTNYEAVKKISDRDPPFSPYLFLFENETITGNTIRTILRSHVIIDAVFGTGLTRPINQEIADLFSAIHVRRKFVKSKPLLVSVDIPSGVDSDSESAYVDAFEADYTVTFTAPKPGNVLAPNHRKNGELIVAQIGTPYELLDLCLSELEVWEKADVYEWLKRLSFVDDSYKNKRGHALIVAGSEDYSGAAVMCGNAAMRSGVGLTTLLVPGSCKVEVASRVIPEVIVRAIGEADGEVGLGAFAANEDVIAQADAILVGPGLKATDRGVEKFVREIVSSRKVPVILDAGALWFFSSLEAGDVQPPATAGGSDLLQKPARSKGTDSGDSISASLLILTPHEGEFMRLLGTDDKDAIKDRVAAVRDFATSKNVILVLKGERVLIGSPDGRVVVNSTGNSGLGKAGNGDTLAGILAGFVAQAVKFDIDIFETIVAAVYVAGMAGDVAEKKYGKRVMTASDVRECLVDVFAEFERISE